MKSVPSGKLAGSAAAEAEVVAFEIDDRTDVRAGLDAGGGYSLSLPPGRYLVMAKFDSGRSAHLAAARSLLVAGCGGGAIALDLQDNAANAPSRQGPEAQASGARSGPVSLAATTVGQRGNPRVAIEFTNGSFASPSSAIPAGLASQLTQRFERNLAGNARDVIFIGPGDRASLSQKLVDLQQLGTDTAAQDAAQVGAAQALEDSVGTEFVVVIAFRRTSQMTVVNVFLVDAKTYIILAAVTQHTSGSDDSLVLGAVDNVTSQLLAVRPSIGGVLRAHQDDPPHPEITVTFSPAHVRAGDHATALITVKDRDDRRPPAASLSLDVLYRDARPGPAPTIETKLQTAAGTDVASIGVPASHAGKWLLEATLQQRERRFTGESFLFAQAAGSVQETAPVGVLTPGATAPVTATVESDGGAVSGVTLQLSTDAGTLDTSTVTTDQNGEAIFAFTAGNGGAFATVTAVRGAGTTANDEAQIEFEIDPGATVDVRADPSNTILAQGVSTVSAVVRVAGAPVPALPVTFDVQGGGTVDTLIGSTDANGVATTLYTAPLGDGTATVTASVVAGGSPYSGKTQIRYHPACVDCPLVVRRDPPDASFTIPKGGTAHFLANQVVTWSATGGAIDSHGVFTAGQAGGLFHVVAASQESPGKTAQVEFIVDCDNSEILGSWTMVETVTSETCTSGIHAMNIVRDATLPDRIDIIVPPGTDPAISACPRPAGSFVRLNGCSWKWDCNVYGDSGGFSCGFCNQTASLGVESSNHAGIESLSGSISNSYGGFSCNPVVQAADFVLTR